MTNCMVEQFGFAIIFIFLVKTCALISGMISFLFGSIRHAEELSTTVVPTAAKRGAHSLETLPPAEKIAMSARASTASAMPMTLYSFPFESNRFAHGPGRSNR